MSIRGKGTHKCASETKQLHSSTSQVTGQLKGPVLKATLANLAKSTAWNLLRLSYFDSGPQASLAIIT